MMAVMSDTVFHFCFYLSCKYNDKNKFIKKLTEIKMIDKKKFTFDFILKTAIDCIHLAKLKNQLDLIFGIRQV